MPPAVFGHRGHYGDYVDTGEYNDDRTHNDANELTARDTDDNGTDDFTLTYDKVGNLVLFQNPA